MAKRWQLIVSLAILLSLSLFFPSQAFSLSHKTSQKTSTKHSLRAKNQKTTQKKIALAKRSTKKRKKTKITTRLMWSAPMVTAPYPAALSSRMKANFQRGLAGRFSPIDLVRAKVFEYCPLRGGIHKRNTAVTNLIVHSTETGRPADAKTVVKSWNNMGFSHPGAQFIVDRDGKIYNTVDPQFATCHVNERRTLRGVTNDNSIGIEVVHQGNQKYTAAQLVSLVRLVDYIENRFPIANIYGHGQIQPSTRTDPVAFNWTFFSQKLALLNSVSTQTAYNNSSAKQPRG